MEWFTNIGKWLLDNIETILAFLSSSTVVASVTAIILNIRQGKRIADNTQSSVTLTESLSDNKVLKQSIERNTKSQEELINDVRQLKSTIVDLRNEVKATRSQTTGLLDVLQVVYATLKDETVRNTVTNIINNVKYSETAVRADLQKQLDELKQKLAENATAMVKDAEQIVNNVKNVVEPIEDVSLRL